MIDTLFLLECHVGKISLEPTFELKPNKKQIVINLLFSDILNSDVDPNDFIDEVEDSSEGSEEPLVLKMGTSYLFSYGPNNLVNELKHRQLEVTVKIDNNKEASAALKWPDNFREMVKLFQRIGMVNSVDYNAEIDLINKSGTVIGTIDLFIRMSCFGYNIETKFHEKIDGDKREYFFKNPKSANTFKCEEYGAKISAVVPIATLYNPVHRNFVDGENPPEEVLSWTKIFGHSDSGSKLSDSPFKNPEIKRLSVIPLTEIFLQSSADAVSICFRPPEHRFINFLNMVSAEVSTTRTETLVTLNQRKRAKMNTEESSEEDDALQLTADKINKRLCKNKDCPAAYKFKEFGIGPLATGKGLGTLYGDVEPPAEYGLSHTYGSMSNYGPYGVFSRPKRLDEPFIPPKNALETPAPPCPNRQEKSCKHNEKNRCPNAVLRLRGGGSSEMTTPSMQESVRDSKAGPKSPFLECKSVMNQFDEILSAYKKALGPCGEATCPYAQNLAEESCKKLCDQVLAPKKSESISCQSIPCSMEECPYKEKSSYPAGCGSVKCAYTKYKLGLVDDDAAMELQFLPPAVSGKCGHPKCKYLLQPPLPPIHWDCPNPLPQGNCKNPNCPFLPPDLKKLKCPPPKKGPCGSTDCPYALPTPCELSTCPFRPQPCPFSEQQENLCKIPQDEDVCENADCPFANRDVQSVSSSDSDLKGQFTTCGSPDCPFASKPKPKKRKPTGCANPTCPFGPKPKQKSGSICENPTCPFASKPKKNDFLCEKPQCPFAPKSKPREKNNICDNPDCPFAPKPKPKPKNICDNPDCPYAERDDEEPEDDICDNPECPLAPKPRKNKPKKKKPSGTCDNPDCPYNEETASTSSESICDNPYCPFTPKIEDPICNDPFCPYIQPLPSCGIPNCPYEPIPVVLMDRSKIKNLKSLPAANRPEGRSELLPSSPPPPSTSVTVKPTTVVNSQGAENEKKTGQGDGKQKENVKQKDSGKVKQKPEGEKSKSGKSGGNGKRKNRGKFVYSIGDKYPGVKIGHRECVTPLFHVPAKMGWLWNITDSPPILSLKPRRGWKPGAIQKSIAARIRAHRQAKGLGMLAVPKFKKLKKGGGQGGVGREFGSEAMVSPKPTLQIQKKDGAYWITMNPLKDPNTLAENENPYMECTPMQFRITKNKKNNEGDNESKLCCCEGENDSSSSSDSELDIEFTPPAGIINPARFRKKKDVVHCDTQYDAKDFQVKKKGGKKDKGKGKGGKDKKSKK